jgi:hypothetical protein
MLSSASEELAAESRTQPPMPRRIRVDLADLAAAFDGASGEVRTDLDLDTGEVVRVTGDVRQEPEGVYGELPQEQADAATYRAAFAVALARRSPPSRRRELLEEADAVEGGLGAGCIRVPAAAARQGYRDREAFIETVPSPRLRAAIRGRGAFRRLEEVLAGRSDQRERWFACKHGRVRERMLARPAGEGIEPSAEAG